MQKIELIRRTCTTTTTDIFSISNNQHFSESAIIPLGSTVGMNPKIQK
jgi:hypothetical protein